MVEAVGWSIGLVNWGRRGSSFRIIFNGLVGEREDAGERLQRGPCFVGHRLIPVRKSVNLALRGLFRSSLIPSQPLAYFVNYRNPK